MRLGPGGRAIARELATAGTPHVVIDNDADRVATIDDHPFVLGDASDDAVLQQAGIERATALIAAVSTDAANLFITLSGRSLRPELFIVSRAREESSVPKLERAGADRVVNPQEIGGARIAAFVLRPHVTEFLDVVMHEREIELRLEELLVVPDSPLAGITLGDADLPERTGAPGPRAAGRRQGLHHQPDCRHRDRTRPDPHRHRHAAAAPGPGRRVAHSHRSDREATVPTPLR